MSARAAILVGLVGLLAAPAALAGHARPVSARIEVVHTFAHRDPIGDVVVKLSDGTEQTWTHSGNASDPRVAPDGVVIWIVYSLRKGGKEIETYQTIPVNGHLAFAERGKVIATVETTKAFIEDWKLAADGHHVIVKSRRAHGPASIQRFAFEPGPAEATVWAYKHNLPDWARPYADDL